MEAGRFLRAVAATVSDLRGTRGASLPVADGPWPLGAGGASPPAGSGCPAPEVGSLGTALALRRLAGVCSRDAGAPPCPLDRLVEFALPSRRPAEVCLLEGGASPFALTWSEAVVTWSLACTLWVPAFEAASAATALWLRVAWSGGGGGASPGPVSLPAGSTRSRPLDRRSGEELGSDFSRLVSLRGLLLRRELSDLGEVAL